MRFTLLLLLLPALARAQTFQDSIVQCNGIVLSKDSLKALPSVSIEIEGTRRGTVTNERGIYGIIALLGQDLVISSVGYKPQRIRVTEEMREHPKALVTILEIDTVQIATSQIRIVPSNHQFNHDFVTTNVSDPAQETAQANLNPKDLKTLSASVPKTAQETTTKQLSNQASKMATNNFVPSFFSTNPLNILNWFKKP